MGSVYLANQLSLKRQVALKILPREMAKDSEFLERFRREARAASKLTHPNIVSAYDIGVADNYHFIAMEYVDGKNLEDLLEKKKRFEEKELLKVAHDMASALEAAEAKGIVHRDIKPANILMSTQGVAKLTDMGLASASQGDQRVTMAGFAVGTPYYISPEQARGELNVDGRADIYSLGATLYHLATGTLPFPGTNPVVIMTQHLKEIVQLPHLRQPAVSQRVSQLIMHMMAKEPSQRHQNATELKADIERCQKGDPPPSTIPVIKAKDHSQSAKKQSARMPLAEVPAKKQTLLYIAIALTAIITLMLVALIWLILKSRG